MIGMVSMEATLLIRYSEVVSNFHGIFYSLYEVVRTMHIICLNFLDYFTAFAMLLYGANVIFPPYVLINMLIRCMQMSQFT